MEAVAQGNMILWINSKLIRLVTPVPPAPMYLLFLQEMSFFSFFFPFKINVNRTDM